MAPAITDRFTSLVNAAAKTFYGRTRDKRIILLQPRQRYHATLVSLLQHYYGDRMYSYILAEEDADLADFTRNFIHNAIMPLHFGNITRRVLQSSDSPSDWGKALAEDLSNLHEDYFLVYLDNVEILPREDQAEFFTALGNNLPDYVHLLISVRETHQEPWEELTNQGIAVSLGDNEALSSQIFLESTLQGYLEVYTLVGSTHVLIDGRPISVWEGSLPRNLFFFFVDKPRVSRTEIFDAFWPALPVKEATNVFHVTKRKISEKLGYDLTAFEDGFYVPDKRLNRMYDADVFLGHIESANSASSSEKAEKHLIQALQIYRGHFLKEVNMDWARQRRNQLRDEYVQALVTLGRIVREQDVKEALAYFIRACGEKPDREDIQREVMQIYADQGQLDEVANQYFALERILRERVGIKPGRETTDLYKKLMRR